MKKTLLTVPRRVCGGRKNSKAAKLRFEKRLLVVMVLFLLPMMANAETFSYNKGIKHISTEIKSKISANDIIALSGFKTTTTQFTDRVMSDLTNELMKHDVKVVTRKDLDKIREEQDYQQSGYVDDASAFEMGRGLGAKAILLCTGENMVDWYRFNFTMLSVEKEEILMVSTIDVRSNSTIRRLINDKAYRSSGIGTTHFLVGARLGPGIEFNTADEDMVGSPEDDGFKPNEESNTAFNAALYGAFRFNDMWSVQTEVNFMVNNGIKISGHGNLITIDYTTLDIPLLVRWNFMQSPVVAGVIIGPYVSLPVGPLNLKVDDRGSALVVKGWTLGATGGFALGYKIGPGSLITDLRFIHDIDLRSLNDSFETIRVRDDFGDGVQDANICVRRSLNITIGYEFYL
jgi:hypothetical protein